MDPFYQCWLEYKIILTNHLGQNTFFFYRHIRNTNFANIGRIWWLTKYLQHWFKVLLFTIHHLSPVATKVTVLI